MKNIREKLADTMKFLDDPENPWVNQSPGGCEANIGVILLGEKDFTEAAESIWKCEHTNNPEEFLSSYNLASLYILHAKNCLKKSIDNLKSKEDYSKQGGYAQLILSCESRLNKLEECERL